MTKWLIVFILTGAATVLPFRVYGQAPHLPVPRFLSVNDPVPLQSLHSLQVRILGPDGQVLDVTERITLPSSEILDQFSDPGLFVEIQQAMAMEKGAGWFYWHQSGDLDYCHYVDLEGNHWYGWAEGEDFHWVLRQGHRYWWRDPMAGHWLYYERGCWWRADRQSDGLIEACVDGEYYLCDSSGKVQRDMGQDGNGDIISAPGIYQGDAQPSGQGHHGSHSRGGERLAFDKN